MITKPTFPYMVIQRLKGKDFLYEYYFKDSSRILDVGCGNGEFVRNDRKRIEGLDQNWAVVRDLQNEGLNVQYGDAAAMPFDEESFDRIHCRNVIEHMYPDMAYKMLKESARVLKKGGLLVLGTEIPTKRFWGTFGHTKPYPPGAILKLLRKKTREEFETLGEFEYVSTIYLGQYYKNRLLYLLSVLVAFYTTLFRREYFVVLKKK